MPHVVEMRIYRLKPGKRDAMLHLFRTRAMPAHAAIGMKILGPFPAVDDPDAFFFMRAFPGLAAREPMKSRFYDGDLWLRELEPVVMPMIDRYEAVLVEDTLGLFDAPEEARAP
jgi:hypothetical protein